MNLLFWGNLVSIPVTFVCMILCAKREEVVATTICGVALLVNTLAVVAVLRS